MKRTVFLLALLLVSTLLNSPVFAQSVEKYYSLGELVSLAYQNNPQLKANDKAIQAGFKQIDYLNKDYLPQVFVDLNVSRWDWALPSKQKLLGNSLNDIYAAFRINQLVYDWNKNAIQNEYAFTSVNIDKASGRRLKQSISYSITKSYLEYLKSKRAIQIQQEAISQLKEHLKNAEALYSIGKVSNLDVVKAKVQIEIALDDLAKAKIQLDVQKNNLNYLCGKSMPDSFDVVDNVDGLWKKYSEINYNFAALSSRLISQHPDLENINTQKELRNKEVLLYKADNYPAIYAFGISNVEDGKFPMGNFNWNMGITLSYSLPFFRGANYQDKVEQTELKISALEETENAAVQQLETNVKNNMLKLEDYKTRLSGSSKIVKLAEESLITANLKYNVGNGNSLDVLDAETILTTAKLNYNQIVIDWLIAIAELNYNIGSDDIALTP
ncbi:MAG TPA: TolC family protein [Ignavibacteriales bacterium]|nr:TolC family protein [Ignavibacteriales bacterium]